MNLNIFFCQLLRKASYRNKLLALSILLGTVMTLSSGCQSPAGMGMVAIEGRQDVPVQITAFANQSKTSYVQMCSLYNIAWRTGDVQMSAIFNVTRHNYFQLNLLWNWAHVSKTQICGLFNIADKSALQLGCLMNWTNRGKVQLLGVISNYAKRNIDCQLGVIWNYSRVPIVQMSGILNWAHTAGFQLSLVNKSRYVISQIGIYNHAKRANFQLGLVNVNKDAWLPWSFLINIYIPPSKEGVISTWDEMDALESNW
jgi:hypothetical protein